eukprot:948628-Prorocentrum_minimum.AAC.2
MYYVMILTRGLCGGDGAGEGLRVGGRDGEGAAGGDAAGTGQGGRGRPEGDAESGAVLRGHGEDPRAGRPRHGGARQGQAQADHGQGGNPNIDYARNPKTTPKPLKSRPIPLIKEGLKEMVAKLKTLKVSSPLVSWRLKGSVDIPHPLRFFSACKYSGRVEFSAPANIRGELNFPVAERLTKG